MMLCCCRCGDGGSGDGCRGEATIQQQHRLGERESADSLSTLGGGAIIYFLFFLFFFLSFLGVGGWD